MSLNTPASILDRVKSTTLDSIVVIASIMLISEILEMVGQDSQNVKMALFFAMLMYEPVCTAFGATIGNDKMNIRVRSASNPEKHINLFQAIIRFVFKVLFGWLSFATIFLNSSNRAIHDYVSGSVMINVDQ